MRSLILFTVFALMAPFTSAGGVAEHLEGNSNALDSYTIAAFASSMKDFCVDKTSVEGASVDEVKETMSCTLGPAAAQEAFGIAATACEADSSLPLLCSDLRCLTGMAKVLASFPTCLSTKSKKAACKQIADSVEKGLHPSKEVLEICDIDSRKLSGSKDHDSRRLDIYTDRVKLYSGTYYSGTYQRSTYCTGPYYGRVCGYPYISSSGMPDNYLSSIKAGAYIDVYLYSGSNYSGYLGMLSNGYQIAQLGNWDNIVSSFKMAYYY